MPSTKDIKAMQKYLHSRGKCGSLSQNSSLCTITENHEGRPHQAQVMGGINDGLILEEWAW